MDTNEIRNRTLRMSNEESRRVTREAVRGALFRLLQTMPLNEIRIVDLVRIAGISRSAFYRNYPSAEAVLLDAMDASIRQILDAVSRNPAENWRLIISTVRSNAGQLKVLDDAGLLHVLLDRMNAVGTPDSYLYAMWTGLIFSVIQRWVRSGMTETDDEILETIGEESRRLAQTICSN